MNYVIKEIRITYGHRSVYDIGSTNNYEEAKKIYENTIDSVAVNFNVNDDFFVRKEERSKRQWKYFIGYIDDNETSSEIIVDITADPESNESIFTWGDDPNTKIDGYYIDPSESYESKIQHTTGNNNVNDNHDVYATKEEAESALAFARISQLIHNDHRFGGLVTTKEWDNTDMIKYQIVRMWSGKLGVQNTYADYSYLSFHTEKQRDCFLKENKELVMKYLMVQE